jgi:cyclic pyranopterin phosphate synthase
MTLSHIDADGHPRMVDVGGKPESLRTATAAGRIRLSRHAYEAIERNSGPKGNVISTAELAGTMAAKKTAELIPLCHPIGLDHVRVTAALDANLPGVTVEAGATTVGRTGVEMEALTAVTVALLTVYDMVKAMGHAMDIGDIRLLTKTGGTSGDWKADEDTAC